MQKPTITNLAEIEAIRREALRSPGTTRFDIAQAKVPTDVEGRVQLRRFQRQWAETHDLTGRVTPAPHDE